MAIKTYCFCRTVVQSTWFRRNHWMVPGTTPVKNHCFTAVNGWFRRNHRMVPGTTPIKNRCFIAVNGWFRRKHRMVPGSTLALGELYQKCLFWNRFSEGPQLGRALYSGLPNAWASQKRMSLCGALFFVSASECVSEPVSG